MITIRPAEFADIPGMAAIRAREWETEPYWLSRIGGYLGGDLSAKQSLPERAVFVAVDDAAIVGFVAGHRTRRYGCDGELQWINVVRERRGEGIAGQLMVRMGEWFVAQNLRRICVDVEPENLVARALYSRHGAGHLNRHWMVWEQAQRMCAQPS
jgi:ribosomal protein S18 acetylase RimI-like enzyme